VVEPGYVPPGGEVDLLVSTDVVSEGQNLQQADAVISYDMPWNPQRVVQRNGRVIRLLSPHDEVQLTTMLPTAGDLDELLHLDRTYVILDS
jgi:superfamily II DNA/RNA helicase